MQRLHEVFLHRLRYKARWQGTELRQLQHALEKAASQIPGTEDESQGSETLSRRQENFTTGMRRWELLLFLFALILLSLYFIVFHYRIQLTGLVDGLLMNFDAGRIALSIKQTTFL